MNPGDLVDDRYELGDELGRGGMGVVYAATDKRDGKRVAVKVLTQLDQPLDEFLPRFRREVRIAKLLKDEPGFVRALGWGRIDANKLFLVMNLIQGARPLDIKTGELGARLAALQGAARRVAAAHKQGIIHRDLKPDNFLVGKDGELWLGDFGLSKMRDDSEDEVAAITLTRSGMGMGTPTYMPPEQFQNARDVDQRADVYALGAMLYVALTGQLPVTGANPAEILAKQIKAMHEGEQRHPREVVSTLPLQLDAVCSEAIALDLEKRTPTVEAFLKGLERGVKMLGGVGPDVAFLESFSYTSDGEQLSLKLGAADVESFCGLLRQRVLEKKPLTVRGAQGESLFVQPLRRKKKAPSWAVEEGGVRLKVPLPLAEAMIASLVPHCGEFGWPGLNGVIFEVVESKIRDGNNKVIRVVGWDGAAPPPLAAQLEPPAGGQSWSGAEPTPGRRWGRRLAGAFGCLLLPPLLFVAFGAYFLRHVPYTIPAADKPPPTALRAALFSGGLRVRYLGISGYEVTDGRTTILLDPVLTRPTLLELLSGPVDSDPELLKPYRLAHYILVNHGHFDHALDAPALALRTGATVVGSQSVVNLALSRGVPAERTLLAEPGRRYTLGSFTVDVRYAIHSHVLGISDPMGGLIPEDADDLWFWQYTNDGSRFYRLESNGTSLWFHPASTHRAGQIGEPPAPTLILGVAGEDHTTAKIESILSEAQPRRVIPTHFDNFFQPLSKGLSVLPVVDLPGTKAIVKGVDPSVEWWVLDHGETIYLPPDRER